MTQISGKKYQIKNAAGTENRFPYTVMEAVLGLNSYLQDQFSALADIYMPIEGITESKTGQEFVYRKSPATIKAKSLTLDRIYGKTLKFNQLIQNGNFADTTGWYVPSVASKSAENNIMTLTFSKTTTSGASITRGGYSQVLKEGHKYYFGIDVLSTEATKIRFLFGQWGTDFQAKKAVSANIKTRVSMIGSITTVYSNDLSIYFNVDAELTSAAVVKFSNCICIDLTAMFGAGNEPATVEEFESMFPQPYYAYNAVTLISNDTSAIETVGFNKWDEEWERGFINDSTGVPYASDYSIRSKNYIPILPNKQYYINHGAQYFYDANHNFISRNGSTGVFTTPDNCAYMKFQYGYSGNPQTTYNHDICINLSDPAKNGTYEPYRKTTLQLGLKTLTGKKNGTGASTVIFPFGLCGEGDVFDEIIQNKATKRMVALDLTDLTWQYNSTYEFFVCNNITTNGKTAINDGIPAICSIYTRSSWSSMVSHDHSKDKVFVVNDSSYYARGIQFQDFSKTGSDLVNGKAPWLNGVYVYYELNEYEEYILDEPLIYTMAAGTTEARISPNADGLSAPFCCDMTYDANANNDSANAQYAATAGRLYNTHKLWGRDFDGSNDVSGALSGVTTIEASGNITTVAQLISTVATGTAPLSVASTTEVANLHSYTATKLHTQRTLWGQNFDGSGNVTGDMSSVGNIAFSASGKNIASLLYFDTTYSRVGVGASSPAYKLDVNGTLNASGNTTLGGTLGVTGNTTIGGTFTVGTSSVNKATTLYGALTASGAVSFTSTLGVTGLSTLAGGIKLTTTKKIWFGDTYYIELDANNHLHTNAGFYSTSFITAGGVGSGSGGGSNLVKERSYDISLTQIMSSDYAELIHSPYISDSESGFMFAYSPAFLDTASQMHDYVIDAIGHEIGSCDIQWIGIAIGSTYTDVGVFDSGAFLVLAKSGNTYYWYEFEV